MRFIRKGSFSFNTKRETKLDINIKKQEINTKFPLKNKLTIKALNGKGRKYER